MQTQSFIFIGETSDLTENYPPSPLTLTSGFLKRVEINLENFSVVLDSLV